MNEFQELQDIKETSQLLGIIREFKNPTINLEKAKMYKALSERDESVVTVYTDKVSGAEVKRSGQELFTTMELETGLRVVYYAKLNEVETPLGVGIYQSMVLRHIGFYEGIGLPLRVMLDYILGLTGLMVCSRKQTSDGYNLWLNVAADALGRGHRLYVWNEKTNYTKQIDSVDKIDSSQEGELWGNYDSYQNKRLIIQA